MKKRLLFGFILLFSVAIVGVISCDDEVKDALNCTELAAKVLEAEGDFSTNQTASTCNDYKNAIQNYLDDCDKISTEEINGLQETLDGLDCSLYD